MVQLGHVVDRPRQLGAGDVLVGGVGGRLVRAGLRLWRISGRTVGLLVRGWRPSSCSQGRTSWSPPLRSTARLAAAMPATTRAEGGADAARIYALKRQIVEFRMPSARWGTRCGC